MTDVLSNLSDVSIPCLDKGFVKLVDCMPRISPDGTADFAIVQAARVSYGDGTKTVNEDRGLIRYLMRHRHTTPFEMVEFKFHCKMPLMVARQWIRHRTANVNEYSGRYSLIKDEFYYPELGNVKKQSQNNKQGGNESLSECDALAFISHLQDISVKSYDIYEQYNQKEVAREQARMLLPVNVYTEWYWKIDLHNLLHFLALRCDSHAQYEIRVFADAMLALVKPIVPVTIEAWEDYHPMRGALLLTKLEVDALAEFLKSSLWQLKSPLLNVQNRREQSEWLEKAARLGLNTNFDSQ